AIRNARGRQERNRATDQRYAARRKDLADRLLSLSIGRKREKRASTEQAPHPSDRYKRAAPVPIAREYAADQRSGQHGNRPNTREQTENSRPKRFRKCIADEHIGESREKTAAT